MTKNRRWLFGVFALAAVAGVVTLAPRDPRDTHGPVQVAHAAPPNAPWQLALTDRRLAGAREVAQAMTRISLVCAAGESPERSASGLLFRLALRGQLDAIEATALACTLDAPPGTSCDQLTKCSRTEGGPTSPAMCDGSVLKLPSADKTHTGHVACGAFGLSCYEGEVGAFCGGAACTADEAYRCEGDVLVSCLSGVEVKTPCGVGYTCGRTTKSRILDCVGRKAPTCGQDRCEGQFAVSCEKDRFGGGTERAVDCAALGLECGVKPDGAGNNLANCFATAVSADCKKNQPLACDGTKVKSCAGSLPFSFTCAELGLTGSCAPSGASVTCK